MTKVYQTKFVNEHGTGNCLQAAVASLLDLKIDQVPDIIDESWLFKMKEFIRDKGYSVSECGINDNEDYMLVIGDSPRGDFGHAVIYKNGELAHDPYPNGSGVLSVSWVASIIKNTP